MFVSEKTVFVPENLHGIENISYVENELIGELPNSLAVFIANNNAKYNIA